jgi:hypothetical protein
VSKYLLTPVFLLFQEGEDMKKLTLNTTYGKYTILYPTGENGLTEIYRGARCGQQLGDFVIGSISSPPTRGVTADNGEYFVSHGPIADQIRSEARKNDVTRAFNYAVIRDLEGNLRILPRTQSCDEGLTKRIRLAESKEAKP